MHGHCLAADPGRRKSLDLVRTLAMALAVRLCVLTTHVAVRGTFAVTAVLAAWLNFEQRRDHLSKQVKPV